MAKSAQLPNYRQFPETCPHYFRRYEEEHFVLMKISCNSCGCVLWERKQATNTVINN